MTLIDAIEAQAPWVIWWNYWLAFGVFVLPMSLVIWRETRVAGLITVAVAWVTGQVVLWTFDQMGYTRLIGWSHVVLWVPLVIYLWHVWRRPEVPDWPRRILGLILATYVASLAFDISDVVRYLLGERQLLA